MIRPINLSSSYTVYKSAQISKNGKVKESDTYNDFKTNKSNAQEVEAIKQQADEALAPLRRLVEKLLNDQGLAYNELLGTSVGTLIPITPEMRTQASALISGNGFYSVENTSSRLANFAVALSGGDKSKIGELRSGIQKGFEAAQKAWGGQLPEISSKTYHMALGKLDKWEKSIE